METAKLRTSLLISEAGLEILKNARVAVIGLGGVGGICAESLARTGIGTLILIDKDTVEESNINRQIPALHSTIGLEKTAVLESRIQDINPNCHVIALPCFYDETFNKELEALHPDYIIDCIDSLKSKKDLIRFSLDHDIPILVSTGTARKKDPSRLQIAEIEETCYDPLAKNLRVWKRKQNIRKKIWCVFSPEEPMKVSAGMPLPSMMFVPAAAGLMLAAKCVDDLLTQSNSASKDI